MSRVYNFSAGPSMLPESVLRKAASELLEYGTSGQSVMEMSHRSKDYSAIIESAQALLREVMEIPDNYKVLFLQGGASSQFAMVPLNLMNKSGKADYVLSGQFSTKAYKEACRFGDVKAVASSKEQNFSRIPDIDPAECRSDADYFHICMNNTIYGTVYHNLPDTGDVPLVADISSCILSKPIDVTKFGLLYAGAQKNMAPAGLTVVIVREDLIGNARDITPTMFDYKVHADADSMYNTPPTYSIYMCKLVLEWIKNEIGGLKEMEKINVHKSGLLYDYLDKSKLFKGCAEKDSRSIMNVTFVTGDPDLDAEFVKEAAAAGFVNIKGHRSVGGMRASIYNAMPTEGIEKLVAFMADFEKKTYMISSDYIIRMIEQIGTVLKRLLEAGDDIDEVYYDEAYMKYLGVNKKLIDRLTAEDIARVLCPSDMSMAAVAAYLLYEDAQLSALKGDVEREQELGRKAYDLMQCFLALDPLDRDDLSLLEIDKFEKYSGK